MAVLDVCSLCGGQGFLRIYRASDDPAEEDATASRCPWCHGSGAVEVWRQAASASAPRAGWISSPPWRLEEMALRATLRQREGN